MTESPARVVDLFCGAGGFSLGFQAAGCQIEAAVDLDDIAARTFEMNFARLQSDRVPWVLCSSADLGSLEERLLSTARPDILIGGPPCQGFSRVGRGKLDDLTEEGHVGDPRNDLFRGFLDIAEAWHPAAVVMENVPGMFSLDGRNVVHEVAAQLALRGYSVRYAVLNAVWYGVPQYRERLFFVGLRDDLGIDPFMPAATHRAVLPPGYLPPLTGVQYEFPFAPRYGESPVALDAAKLRATTVDDALGDLPALHQHLAEHLRRGTGGAKDIAEPLPYRTAPGSPFARLMRNWPTLPESPAVIDHAIRYTPRDYDIFRMMEPGDRYPSALRIARRRFEEEVQLLAAAGCVLKPGTPAYLELERRFVPPYPHDKFVDKWRKLVPWQPSWTVTAHLAKDTYSHIHYDRDQARCISVREAARLQSFPDSFSFAGNMGESFRQIGNAVPPLLAWAVACAVLQALGQQPRWPRWEADAAPSEHSLSMSPG